MPASVPLIVPPLTVTVTLATLDAVRARATTDACPPFTDSEGVNVLCEPPLQARKVPAGAKAERRRERARRRTSWWTSGVGTWMTTPIQWRRQRARAGQGAHGMRRRGREPSDLDTKRATCTIECMGLSKILYLSCYAPSLSSLLESPERGSSAPPPMV